MNLLANVLRTGLPFGLIFGVGIYFVGGLGMALAVGLGSGLVFGLAVALFAEMQRRHFLANRPDFGDETLLHEGPANYFRGLEAVGGWLTVTSRRLHFRSHGMNVQNETWELPLASIREVDTAATLGIIPNGLRFTTSAGGTERFVVPGRRKWKDAIERARRGLMAG